MRSDNIISSIINRSQSETEVLNRWPYIQFFQLSCMCLNSLAGAQRREAMLSFIDAPFISPNFKFDLSFKIRKSK